jgi:hypothetical protein
VGPHAVHHATGWLLNHSRATQAHVTEMFRTIAASTALIVTVILPLLLLAQPDAFWRALQVIGVVDALVLVTLSLNRYGSTRFASWLYLGVILTLLTFNAPSAGGIRSPGAGVLRVRHARGSSSWGSGRRACRRRVSGVRLHPSVI